MQSVFIEKLYDETLCLMEDARDYLLRWERQDRERLSMDDRLSAAGESLRMTARLTSVMAWVMIQKAVHSGEVTAQEMAEDDNRLLVTELHLASLPVDRATFPARLWPILERSARLFARVRHLDELAARQPQALPASSILKN